MKLQAFERAQYKRALLRAGKTTAGLTDIELEQEYNALNGKPLNNAARKLDDTPKASPIKPRAAKPAPAPKTAPAPKEEPKAAPVAANGDDLAAAIARAVSGLIDQGQVGLDESRVIELIGTYASGGGVYKTIEVKNLDTGSIESIDTPHDALEQVLIMAACRVNTYLHGPAGSGKTTLAKQVAKALSLPFYYTGAVMQKYELLGFIDAGGTYQKTSFRDAYEHGGVFLFDELDASIPGALVAFNAAIDNGLCAFPDNTIDKHPDFICIATANTIGKGANRTYIGRTPLDGATLDRYQFVELDYSESIERQGSLAAYLQFGGEDESEVSGYVDTVRYLRQRAESLGLSCIISPRASLQGAKLLAAGLTLDAVKESCIFGKLSADERRQLGAN